VKTLQKRLDAAAVSLADMLNTHVFGHNGPTGALCETMGVSKGTKVLGNYMPDTYTGPAIPRKETECNAIPAAKEAPPHLVLALGLLRRFDAERNSAVPNQSPQCSFKNTPIIKGLNRLDQHGPLGFEVLYAGAAGLGGLFQSNICGVNDPNGVGLAMGTKLTM
jgi:hypothetical protein